MFLYSPRYFSNSLEKFFSIKLLNLHYTNKEHTIKKIKNTKKITTHELDLMNYFKSHKVVKITTNINKMIKTNLTSQS